ncbi:MAG: hypothetical protein OXF31_08360 [Gammaproteobacteria bacterium]|nr:hypothetical protein [Gammaproteobacteria bacterium]
MQRKPTAKIHGSVSIEPLYSAAAIRCDGTVFPDALSVVSVFPKDKLAAHVVVPVKRRTSGGELTQKLDPTWDRLLNLHAHEDQNDFSKPILLSSRHGWLFRDSALDIYDRAIVLDGAKRLEAALMHSSPKCIPVIAISGLNATQELEVRARTLGTTEVRNQSECRERIGTTAPRLIVDDNVVLIKILSDPFVVATSFGYAPALLVQRKGSEFREHLLVGAKSLTKALERMRINLGTLKGIQIKIRKDGREKSAPYLVQEL